MFFFIAENGGMQLRHRLLHH